jgi:hypothetical protein
MIFFFILSQNLKVGIIEEIQLNKNSLAQVRAGNGPVAVKIIGEPGIAFGRQFNQFNTLASVVK